MSAPGSGIGMEQFRGDTLATANYDPAVVEQATATINRHARDEGDRQLLAAAIFGTLNPVRHHGDKPNKAWAEARSAWLERVREWVRFETGRVPVSTAVSEADQVAYIAATGDEWRPPKPVVLPVDREHHYRYPEPIGDAGAAYRRRVREWAAAQGRATYARGALEAWLLNAYCDATGDVWDPVAQEGASALVPVGPAREHMQRLNAAGMSQEAMAAAVPMSIGAVSMILRGRTGRGEQTRIRRETEGRILAVAYPDPAADGMAA